MKKPQDTEAIYQRIFALVRCIPTGRVTSYGAIAYALGLASGARLVGRAMGSVDGLHPPVPAQRVVTSSGTLSGDQGKRQAQLEAEGVAVRAGKVVDFKRLFWDPLRELEV